MACDVTSWIPDAVAVTLRAERSAQPVIAWLSALRASIEEYDPLVIVRPPSGLSEDSDSAFDEILSQLGKEIYKLDEYQRHLAPAQEEVSLSILNIFDECLESMNASMDQPKQTSHSVEGSDVESNVSDVSFATRTPVGSESRKAPVPKPRLKTPSVSSSIYENLEVKCTDTLSDSESTCWSYKECNRTMPPKVYAAMWSHSSGFHNSDGILQQVLSERKATISRISRLSFDTASDFSPPQFSVYSLQEVGEPVRCTVADMTPDKCDDGYEPVRDAITDEHIYEDIEFTDEGCSSGCSVEVESYSISASSEGMDESPYANLRDNDAYAVPADVIFWKNMLLDPFYNDDEEDDWITPEECEVYSQQRRPPLVIPRITQFRPPRQTRPHIPEYPEESLQEVPAKSWNWSPTSERGRLELERSFSKASDSPPFTRLHKRLGGSTENLLANARRPNYLQLPASSSGDSLDVEVRDREPEYGRNRKSRSMMAPKNRMRSPVPTPRLTESSLSIVLEGPIKRTKYKENGKKTKKHWTDCYMLLTPTGIIFYKDERTYLATKTPKPPGTPPSPAAPRAELVLPLRNAHVIQCLQTHTRRYTRSLLLTVGHDQYLLQDESENEANKLLNYIQRVIYKLGPGLDYPTPQYQSSNTDLESLGRTPPVSRHARSKHKAGGSSNEDLNADATIQKSQVKTRLIKFFAKRPTVEVLVNQGIYKDEPVFGQTLEKACPSSPTAPRVPKFVVACINEIESSEENMCTDGLYRASGNLSQVQKIRLEVDQQNLSVIENNTDIHVLTGSLKLFFRELKEPLIPCSMFDRVLAACSIKPREARIKEFRDIVQSLPQCNRDTLKFLLEHLLRVTQYSEKNRMHTANLAIVFGPTLLWAPAEQAHNIAIDCIQQNNVVDILLTDFKEIFEDKTKKK